MYMHHSMQMYTGCRGRPLCKGTSVLCLRAGEGMVGGGLERVLGRRSGLAWRIGEGSYLIGCRGSNHYGIQMDLQHVTAVSVCHEK